MNSLGNSTRKTGAALLMGFLLVATISIWQKTTMFIKNAINDSAKLRPTANSCSESNNSESAHFTGCSSIL